MEHENKFDKIKQKPNLAVVGCIYSHFDDKGHLEAYKALEPDIKNLLKD